MKKETVLRIGRLQISSEDSCSVCLGLIREYIFKNVSRYNIKCIRSEVYIELILKA